MEIVQHTILIRKRFNTTITVEVLVLVVSDMLEMLPRQVLCCIGLEIELSGSFRYRRRVSRRVLSYIESKI